MNFRFLRTAVLALCFVLCMAPLTAQAAGSARETAQGQCLSASKVKLKEDMRRLWMDHVTWTRNYIVSAVAGAPDQQKVLDRLLKNQQDIGNAIKPYYGEAAGNKLTELLRQHILLAGKILDAAKKGNTADVEKFNKEWYANADTIAQFLASANPNWPENTLKDLLHEHLRLVTEAVTARLGQNWDADISAYDRGVDHIVVLADALTEGIIKQFPDKFR
ncbi:glycosyltransferase [Paenibacillus sp. N4]|uniref:glycosyltransferase n=1 Tax=Paenibacillus vietnamensis TaxID=2590547 RepID=UPI0037C84BE8|nr:glycosyltransferase [Paenibacillus vietnamensis]